MKYRWLRHGGPSTAPPTSFSTHPKGKERVMSTQRSRYALARAKASDTRSRRCQILARACSLEALEMRVLLSGGIPDHFRQIDSLRLDKDNAGVTSNVTLKLHQTYYLSCDGYINADPSQSGRIIDAEHAGDVDEGV